MDKNLKGTILLIYYTNNNTYIPFIQSCRTTKVSLLIVLLFLFFTLRIELFNRIFPSKMKGCTTHCVFISGQNTVKTRVLPVFFFLILPIPKGAIFFFHFSNTLFLFLLIYYIFYYYFLYSDLFMGFFYRKAKKKK